MNIIKKVVVFVMGLVVIGVVATTIGVVTQTKTVEKNVTFELLENNDLEYNVYDKINGYAVVNDNTDLVTNLVSISINSDSNVYSSPYILITLGNISISDNNEGEPSLDITSNNTYITNDFSIGDIISITFDVEQETPAIIKTLLVLIPLVFTASLIGYLSLSTKKGD